MAKLHPPSISQSSPSPIQSVGSSVGPSAGVQQKAAALPTKAEIAAAAVDLNAASDELAQSVSVIDAYLSKQNIGIPAWVTVKAWENPDSGNYFKRELGYDRVWGSWQLSIRETSGPGDPLEEQQEYWPFSQSPRKARISAVDKIPELLRELLKEAERVARRLREKSAEVNALAADLAEAKRQK